MLIEFLRQKIAGLEARATIAVDLEGQVATLKMSLDAANKSSEALEGLPNEMHGKH